MIKKNNKGFFLVEAIVVIALVSTVVLYVYPNINRLFENSKYQLRLFDQTEDIYLIKAVYNKNTNDFINSEYIYKNNNNKLNQPTFKMDLEGYKLKFYVVSYLMSPTVEDDRVFNIYLSRLKKKMNDKVAYRIIMKKCKDTDCTYSSIKIDDIRDE